METLSLPTSADATPESDGSVTIQILAHSSDGTTLQYSVGGNMDFTKTTMLLDDDDNDLPNVTIAA